ncbi:MAG: hypothetical protein ACE5JU_07860 [Candidatus Binatia bacterium]
MNIKSVGLTLLDAALKLTQPKGPGILRAVLDNNNSREVGHRVLSPPMTIVGYHLDERNERFLI